LKERNIDLCVSGINHGSNASINILYSGTLSAAMEASLEGIPSIGFSLLNYSHEADFEPSKLWALKIMRYVLENPAITGRLLNVNIPNLPAEEIKGLKVCRQGDARWVEEFLKGHDPNGQPYYWLAGKFINYDQGEDSDIRALEEGYVSVVPSMHDLTNYLALPAIKSLETY
jgi:5'-nucleotidase